MKFPRIFKFRQVYNVLYRFWGNPKVAWQQVAETRDEEDDSLNSVLYTMMFVCGVVAMLSKLVEQQNIVNAILWGLVEFGILLVSYNICLYVCRKERTYQNQNISNALCNKIVLYPFTIVMGVNMAHNLLPGGFFIYFLLGYVLYEVWIASESLFEPHESRDWFLGINAGAIIVVPLFMEMIMKKMLVNI
ncbi:MAG: hypothetical protein MJZ98_03005 [Paludibacteraceae bacterium]|nr:hypothetical protein [Paludibacteraceae bacterium]